MGIAMLASSLPMGMVPILFSARGEACSAFCMFSSSLLFSLTPSPRLSQQGS